MKRIRKIISFVIAAALSASCLAGCGEEKKSENIVIGSSGPLTGSAAQYGIAVKNAAELAVKEINDAGGVNGTKFEFYFEDDQADPGDKA
ncbi:MAG: ABC transporter substrate-binding protein, partial [Porcipelethomonas sp.]